MKILNGHCRWSVKIDEHDNVNKFKARYVIDGSELNAYIYSPVVNIAFMRALLSTAVKYNHHIHVVDVKNAYLNSPLDEDIYINPIPLFSTQFTKQTVLKLNKNSYGLPQSAFNWFNTLSELLLSLDLNQSKIDKCIFYSLIEQTYILIYVDDIIIIAPTLELINKYKELIRNTFSITDKGEIKLYLGMEFNYQREKNMLQFNQTQKIINLYERVKLNCGKATKLPLPENADLDQTSTPLTDIFTYESLVGEL